MNAAPSSSAGSNLVGAWHSWKVDPALVDSLPQNVGAKLNFSFCP
jgi:hypothetical protein